MNLFSKLNCIIFSLIFVCLFASCASYKKYAYFQDLIKDSTKREIVIKQADFLLKIRPDDILAIDIISSNPQAAAPFNLNNITGISGYNNNNTEAIPMKSSASSASITVTAGNGYLVDREGNIQLPYIGKLHVEGMTIPALKDTLSNLLRNKYIKDAIVNAKISNAGAIVMGQVGTVNRIPLDREKTSIIDALATSGDISQLGTRENVLLIREKKGKKEVYHLDLRNSSIIESDQYYLQQNDIVYVPPRKEINIANDNMTFRYLSYLFSAVSVVSLIIALSK